MSATIHPTAIVGKNVALGADVKIGPLAVIEEGAVIGDGCHIHGQCRITRWTRLAPRVVVHPMAVIGGDPQDLKFDPSSESFVEVGEGAVLRESVTIHRSTKPGMATRIGPGCLLMACSHVAHDSVLHERVIVVNNVLIGGHVEVHADAFIGGGAALHQFCRVGTGAMIGGETECSRDIPPFTMVAQRDAVIGLNLVGLKRRQTPRESIAELKTLFHLVYAIGTNPRKIATDALTVHMAKTPHGRTFLEFFATGKRGFARLRRVLATTEDEG